MKHIHILQVIVEISALIGSENAQGETDQGPQMDRSPGVIPHFRKIMNLGVAVVARCDAVVGAGGKNLIGLDAPVGAACILIPRLEKPAAAAATEVVGAVRGHVDEVFFPYH